VKGRSKFPEDPESLTFVLVLSTIQFCSWTSFCYALSTVDTFATTGQESSTCCCLTIFRRKKGRM